MERKIGKLIVLPAVIGLSFGLVACGSNGDENPPALTERPSVGSEPDDRDCTTAVSVPDDLAGASELMDTPREYGPAEVLALLLDNTFVADFDTYRRVNNDLVSIYQQHSRQDSAAIETCWTNSILVAFEDEYADDVGSGNYAAWDSLNSALKIESIDDRLDSQAVGPYVVIRFEGRYNMPGVVEAYGELEGVRFSEVNGRIGAGSSKQVCAVNRDEKIYYMFRQGWGDCPSGCIYSEYAAYVSHAESETDFIGEYNTETDSDAPEWFDDLADCRAYFN